MINNVRITAGNEFEYLVEVNLFSPFPLLLIILNLLLITEKWMSQNKYFNFHFFPVENIYLSALNKIKITDKEKKL